MMAQAQTVTAQQPTDKRQTTLALFAVFATYFGSSYLFRGFGVALPRIAADLNGMPLYSSAISLPALASAFVTLTFGKLSDMYGRRILLLVSLTLYLIGAILAAVSETFIFFIAARTIMSLGQGALPPLTFSVVGDLYPPAERSKWSGLLQIPAGIAAVVVPTFVGILTDKLSWRYFFWISVLLVLICGVFVLIGIPSLSKRTAHRIDFSGTCLLAVASSAMILAFSWAGNMYPWTSTTILCLLGASAVSWIIFFWIEGKADEPMLDPQVLTNRTFLIAAIAALTSYFALLGVVMYFPLFLQGIQGTTATLSGQIVTPFSALMAFVGVPTGILLSRTKRYKSLYIMGYAILTVATFAMVAFTARTPAWLEILVISFAGLGLGAIPTMNTLVAQFALPKRLLGVAVGAMFFFVFMGGAIAPAILGSAMNAVYAGTLQKSLPSELNRVADKATLESLADSKILLSQPAMDALEKAFQEFGDRGPALFETTVQAIRNSLEAGLKMVFLIGAVTVLFSFLLIFAIPEVPIDVEVEDNKIQTTKHTK
ncbi:MAG: MFS transporter [Acidobacteriota bacterium]